MEEKMTKGIIPSQANTPIESNEGKKNKKTKYVVSFLECRKESMKKKVRIVGIYDTRDMAKEAARNDMIKEMRLGEGSCYVEHWHVSWSDVDDWWFINEVAA